MVKTINAKTANEWLANNEAVLVDVREPAEFAAWSIPGATLIPVNIIDAHNIPDVTNKKLIIHCKMGGRGGVACEKLQAAMPDLDVYNLEGGITAWESAGLPVNKG